MRFFPEFGDDFLRLLESLEGKRIAVLGHLRPDADCLGSQVALCRLLMERGIEAVCVNFHPVPRALRLMVGDTPFFLADDFDAEGWTAVTVDCADIIRIGDYLREKFPHIYANIDHHISNPAYAERNLIDPTAAATGEVLAGLMFDLGLPVDVVSAQAMYVAIATDTGMFRYESITPRVFEIAAELLRRGASPSLTASWLFENEPFGKIELLRLFLESVQKSCDGRLCYGVLPLGCFSETGTTKEDAEGFVDYTRDVAGVDIGLVLEEYEPGKTKGSFRANSSGLRVDLLAIELGGGGHATAAGFNQPLSLKEFLPKVEAAVAEHLKQYDAGALLPVATST
ncbi:DHH family phosphoesterase [Rubellicoccus peritrichatus]|uniref:DHH family phosphoesterase n=1 Tax=Rubellicoccus peritrichatus TaxID=3080537 RepID=A0AAQ3QRN0_9BACT|nr:DHH family phosphoesterase [Puniceicoccus sp. CR14]WOO39466.1 DHH family phosphoesterase [Puniceicoccus sp. CR14]